MAAHSTRACAPRGRAGGRCEDATEDAAQGQKLADGSRWTWDVGTGLVDPQSKSHPASGFSSESRTIDGVSTDTETYDFHGPSMPLGPGASGTMSTGGRASTLVTMIDSNTSGACVLKELGKPDRNCTLGGGRSQPVKR